MLNENIKAIRKSKGLSQQELAIKLNVVCTFRINGAPFPRQRCKRLAPAVRYPFVVTC